MSRYLRNIWYVAAWSDEIVADKILARTILETPVALFRRADGAMAAVLNRCPHRFAPLSAGQVRGDNLICGYHGLGFNGSGVCSLNPHGPVPRNMRIPSYPTHEAHRAVWIWMGDSERADPALIPDFSYLGAAPETAFSKGNMVVRANYEIFVDNILDLSHTDYLHATTLGGGAITKSKPEVVETDEYIEVTWFSPSTPPSPLLVKCLPDLPKSTDTWAKVRWFPPGVMRLVGATAATGAPIDQAWSNHMAHILTPETETSSHYFYAATRNYRTEDSELNKFIAASRNHIFDTEDRPMLELVQKRMTQEFWEMKPMLLSIDRAPVQVRRKLSKLIETETAAAAVDLVAT